MGDRATDDLALIIYVEHKDDSSEPVPTRITFTPAGHDHPVELLTDVVEAAPTESE